MNKKPAPVLQKTKVAKMTQVNTQKMIVNLPRSFPRHLPKRESQHCKKEKSPVLEKISGRIFQKCDDNPRMYFRSVDEKPSALVQVENKSNCIMEIIVQLNDHKKITHTIEREQQVSISVPSIEFLEIACSGDSDTFCRGFYSICLRHKFH